MRKNKKNIRKCRNLFRKSLASMLLLMLLGVFLLPKLAYASAITDENIIQLTNQVRVEQGLLELSANQLLSKAAYEKAETIFSKQIFKHDIDGKKFSDWVREAEYEYQNIGENLAIDFVTSEGTMNAWLSSPSHKKNILNPKFEEIGIAVKPGNFEGHDSILVVQIFGTPLGQIAENKNPAIDPNIGLINSTDLNTTNNQESLLTNTAPKTLLIAQANDQTKNSQPGYLNEINPLYGQEYLSLEYVEQTILYIIDYAHYYLMSYYFTVIALLLLVFSSSFIWHKGSYWEKLKKT